MNKNLYAIALGLVLLAFGVSVAAQTESRTLTLRGTLARTVEANGWVLNTEQGKYLLLNGGRFQNESWFNELVEVEVTGETRPGAVTIHQEGIPFEVRTARPIGGSSTSAGKFLTRVTVSGNGEAQAAPDTATISFSVQTQRARALDAQQENARISDAVVSAVRAAAGADAVVRTTDYSLDSREVEKEGQPTKVVGYDASNTVRVTLRDLSRVSPVIDAAAKAGANNVQNLNFLIRDDHVVREEALTKATADALNKARVIARTLNGRVVRIAIVSEPVLYEYGRQSTPLANNSLVTISRGVLNAEVSTPVQIGLLERSAQVQMVVDIEAQP